MSIIHEALKKAQSNRSESKNLKEPKPAFPNDKETPKPNPASWLSIVLWGGLILAVCILTIFNLYEFAQNKKEMARTKFSAAAATPLTATMTNAATANPPTVVIIQPPPVPQPPKPKKGELLLTGIVIMDGKNFALVNNQFFEVGEKVEGATITKITDDSIEVLQKGKTRTIKVIRPD